MPLLGQCGWQVRGGELLAYHGRLNLKGLSWGSFCCAFGQELVELMACRNVGGNIRFIVAPHGTNCLQLSMQTGWGFHMKLIFRFFLFSFFFYYVCVVKYKKQHGALAMAERKLCKQSSGPLHLVMG